MVSREAAEHYRWGGDCDGWRLVQSPGLSVIHERMPPGRSEVRHYHAQARQFFFVLSGVLTIESDGAVEHLQPQQGLEMAPGTPHQVFNRTSEAVEFLVVSQPATSGDRIETP